MKEENAIKLIQKYEPLEGYFVAFSGGKDSVVMYDLVKKSGVLYRVFFMSTTIDPPEVLKFIRKEYPEVIWLRPKKSMYKLIQDRGLPTRVSRYCCAELKEYAGNGETIVTGIRWEESNSRKCRDFYEKDDRKKKWYVNPIINWEEWEVWDYIEKYKLPICELYDLGYGRIGCVGCPMAYFKQRQRELNRYPRFVKMYKKAIRKRMDKGFFKEFKDENDVYEWWIGNVGMDEYLRQYKIDFDYK